MTFAGAPPFSRILVANRGEIAVRILRAARELEISTAAVHARDDRSLPYLANADVVVNLGDDGPAAYLSVEKIVSAARDSHCDAIHPGYGFLSERADLATACNEAGVVFIGPDAAHLELFGDKAAARALAQRHGVPVMPGSQGAVSLQQALEFFDAQRGSGVMIKAIGGGGGRGMRAVFSREELPSAHERCVSEAHAAFGVEGVYVERLMRRARHIEIQVLGDGRDVISLGDRECTVQRRFQKLVEVAPSLNLSASIREAITEAALRMARSVSYRGLGTFEFLVDEASSDLPWVYIETNARLQVEHTITEEVSGVDLVQAQIRIASGQSLQELGLAAAPAPRGFAVQWRINGESLAADGTTRPSSGRLTQFTMPSGPGIRVDTFAETGLQFSSQYDTLLAKVIVTSPTSRFADLVRRARRALSECRIEGVVTNLGLQMAIAERPDFESQALHTRYVEEHLPELLSRASKLYGGPAIKGSTLTTPGSVPAPMTGKLIALKVAEGDLIPEGSELAVIEAMKMEHVVLATMACRVVAIQADVGEQVEEGTVLMQIAPAQFDGEAGPAAVLLDPDAIRPDLQAVIDRHAFTLDRHRPEAVAARHAKRSRTARENIAALCDDGSFNEYGALAVAAQSRRRSMDDLIENTPADGMVTGIGAVNADAFGAERAQCAVMAYDYTVLAGTQGARNHRKTERLVAVARDMGLPLVVFAEGGGGRPGDVDVRAGLDILTFRDYAALSGSVPMVAIAHGRCFAGNAALLGCSDAIIATHHSNIGMSGPAMIEAGGLGRFRADEVGPSELQSRNGVIDVLVEDEAAAAAAARKYLSYFQGRLRHWQCADQRLLRNAVPENRLRSYDVRAALGILVDEGSLMELRAGFGAGVITALARIEGIPFGLMANNPKHLGGAIDADAADKSSRFMRLCDVHSLPLISLMDTPGFMVGPDVEAEAQVRHACRMFLAASHLSVPFFAIIMRKGYGLGAQAMAAGSFHAPVFTVSWPTGEFGPMGIEGAVRLGYRRELEVAATAREREVLFQQLLDKEYANSKALAAAQHLEVDAVIDPADTRAWLVRGLVAANARPRPAIAQRFIDAW